MNSDRISIRWSVLVVVAALAVGLPGLVACGGGEQRGGEQATTTQAAEAEAEQARIRAEQELQARRDRLAQARTGISEIGSTAASELPVQDEQLSETMDALEKAAAEAEAGITGEQADAALARVEQLREQASERLATLREREQEARQALRERYDEVVGQSQELPADLVWGLDGEIYLDYRRSAVENAQRALKERGFYTGPVDGDLDQDTRVALARFQQVNGLHVTGIPTPYTRSRLGV